MSRFNPEQILVEKSMNMFPNTEKSSIPAVAATIKRAPLTKAYSCSDAIPTNSTRHCAFISPREFVELVSQTSNAQDLPILDCRSQMDFGCERIRSSHNINCRTKIVARKLSSKRLEDVEPNLSSSLNKSSMVILYDQSTDARGEDKLQSLPINLVVQAAQKSNKIVQIIEGGLDAIKTEYPHLVECPTDTYKTNQDSDLNPPPSSPDAIDKENVAMTEILPHLFVGNVCDAQNLDRLTENGITHILNCTPDLPFYWANKHQCMRIDVLDLPSQNIRAHFDTAIDFIDDALRVKDNNVLVHCSAGISRSPTLVLAYMMKKTRCTLDEAFEKMRQLRRIVDPNCSFIFQLRDWEKCLQSSSATAETTSDNSGIVATPGARATSSTYCGSTSKNKSETKARTDGAIIVT